jgi:predicted Fe-S protein YdhL (DUF1289 family)
MSMMVANWKKQDPKKKQEILQQAEKYLSKIEQL